MNTDGLGGPTAPPRWNLATSFSDPYVGGATDPWTDIVVAAREFERRHLGTVGGLEAVGLAHACRELEHVVERLQRLTTYAEMLLAAKDDDPAGLDVLDRCEAAWDRVVEIGDAFERELAALDDPHVERLLAQPALADYAHHIRTVRATASLSPPAGTTDVLARLEPVAVGGWERLGRQLLARIEVADGTATMALGTALPVLYDADRARRHRVCAAVSRALEPEVELRATALSMAARARSLDSELRGNPDWTHAPNVMNDVTAAEVAALLDAVADHHALPHRYYRAKASLFEEDLTDADRYAPVGQPPPALSWADCREFALDTLAAVAGELADAARDLLDDGVVDAAPRPGKRRGALTFTPPGAQPHVLLNFTGQARDALTAVHELAHAVHARLAGHRGLFTTALPTVLAETVGLFAEAVAAQRLADVVDRTSSRLFVLGRRVEDQLVAVFREAALHRFERRVYSSARDHSLDAESLAEMWLQGQRDLYGPAVTLTPGYRHWWSYLDSLFLTPASGYAYAYGQLAALALLTRHRDDPRRFADSFLAVLREGAARPPAQLLASLGVDVYSPASWQSGLDALRDDIEEFTKLAGAGDELVRPGIPVG